MNTETITVHPKNDGFEIVVQHDQTGSAYGIDLSKDAYEQLRLHFVVGQSEQLADYRCPPNERCKNICDECAVANGMKQG